MANVVFPAPDVGAAIITCGIFLEVISLQFYNKPASLFAVGGVEIHYYSAAKIHFFLQSPNFLQHFNHFFIIVQ